MNKFLSLLLALVCFSCHNTVTENAKDQTSENSHTSVGYVVTSNVTPAYLLNIGNYYNRNDTYTEFLSANGFPGKLSVLNDEDKASEIAYTYDEKNRLIKISAISALKKGNVVGDTMNYLLQYSDLADTKPVFVDYNEYSISFSPSFLIQEYKNTQPNGIGNGKLNVYDERGRPASLILFYDHGLDSEITYEKYTYNSDDLIWTSRQVEQVIIKMDSEELSAEKLRTELLKFPANFDEVKTVFTDTRQVKKQE